VAHPHVQQSSHRIGKVDDNVKHLLTAMLVKLCLQTILHPNLNIVSSMSILRSARLSHQRQQMKIQLSSSETQLRRSQLTFQVPEQPAQKIPLDHLSQAIQDSLFPFIFLLLVHFHALVSTFICSWCGVPITPCDSSQLFVCDIR